MDLRNELHLRESEEWEKRPTWPIVLAEPVLRHRMAPREALRILEVAGQLFDCGFSVDDVINRLKQAD